MTSVHHTSQATAPVQAAIAGEALIDLIRRPDGSYLPCLGGALYNLCRALARQGVGTQYLNPLSRDRFGRELAAQLVADGVLLAQPGPVQQVTSLAVVNLNEHGHPDYAFYREGVADRAVSAHGLSEACAALPALQLVCTGALALDARDTAIYQPWLAAQRAEGRCVVVDANLRPSVMPDLDAYRTTVHAALAHAHIIKASDEDLDHLAVPGTGALARARHLLAANPQAHLLALTLGAEGAWLLHQSGMQCFAKEAQPLRVIDTVGAGDSFLAGLLAHLLRQAPAAGAASFVQFVEALSVEAGQQALRHALASASLCVMEQGCVPPGWEAASGWARAHPCVAG
ncbi:carbohydrate kinase [Acidovorax sp. sif1233]|uniref:PfkB family carbohydrate kinase n=1 Tax=unclassified Acidovorax TaxID=2684926 RepID=UPI001C477C94|nr:MULTISPECIES: PfkB family carbohydrate kinase [unclassified Acidovorax]MBV7431101.1 carbohydrate kinase [Acidovorax sp. sif0732]MBV7452207.1 carbohydrate kinase [Acidovorax sp. sif0715]MBV7457633.1 carbohydrate kinase [Acidovorax sp. sif1233]